MDFRIQIKEAILKKTNIEEVGGGRKFRKENENESDRRATKRE